jgi:hypothetical protein
VSDVHTRTAAAIFGVPEDGVTPEQRMDAKSVNFHSIWGQPDNPRTLTGRFVTHEFRPHNLPIRSGWRSRPPLTAEQLQAMGERWKVFDEIYANACYYCNGLRTESRTPCVAAALQGFDA